jgi:hypothetical protein
MEARARVRDLELYVAHLEQYNAILHEEVETSLISTKVNPQKRSVK